MSSLTAAARNFSDLDALGAARLACAAGDIALVLDRAGTVLDVMAPGIDLPAKALRQWRGRAWPAIVTSESRDKVEALLRDADTAPDIAPTRWRHVNHPIPGNDDLPVLYVAVRLRREEAAAGAKGAGAARKTTGGHFVAIGRDLRNVVALQRRLVETQQAMERDYWRFREAETRYKHLFETSSEAVLIVEGDSQRVVEANPVARSLCAGTRGKLVGTTLASLFEAGQAPRVQDLLAAARSIGRQAPVAARLAGGGDVTVAASVFRQENAAFVLVRLAPQVAEPTPRTGRAGRAAPNAVEGTASSSDPWNAVLQGYIAHSPDGVVFCDGEGRIRRANRAFLTLAQLSSEDQARGQPLDHWIGRTGVEMGVLIGNLRQRGSVGLFQTTLRGEYGARTEIEITGALLPEETGPLLAFAVRDVERRARPAEGSAANATPTMQRSAAELAELVGRTPLKEIVAESTDLIEQMCIQAALAMTGDNRASAAQLLGLSRQSLYVKLRRFGISELETRS